MWIVYLHTNKTNGKIYCGVTCQTTNRRWRNGRGYENCIYFNNAIKKYGWEGFDHDVIYKNISEESANQLEMFIIKQMKLTNTKFGYNIREGGGNHGKLSEESKKKISIANSGNHHTEEAKLKISITHRGAKNNRALLTNEQVLEIRKIRFNCNITSSKAYEKYKDKYNISLNCFYDTWCYYTYEDIGIEYNTEEVKNWHKLHHGSKGEDNGFSKLMNVDVENIKLSFICGASLSFLVNKYKTTSKTINRITSGENYKSIREDLNNTMRYIKDNKPSLPSDTYRLYVQGLSYDEIELILNIRKDTISKYVSKGRMDRKKNNLIKKNNIK